MSAIVLEALGFHYESTATTVFRDVDLRLDTSWRTGLVGRNGRGKTTLLRLIEGAVQPQRGRLDVPVAVAPFTPASIGLPGSSREVVRESVAPFRAMERDLERLAAAPDPASLERYGELALEYERLGGYTIDHRIEQEWAAMELRAGCLDQPHAALSGGERTRASIVALFLRPGGYPLIDEPTNHLDLPGRERLARYLVTKPGFLMVSHDRALLDRCCDHFVAIERGALRVHAGDYTSLRVQQQQEEEMEARQRENLSREIRDLEQAARSRRDWSAAREATKRGAFDKGYIGHRAAKMMKRALHSERLANEKLEQKRSLLRIPEKRRTLSFQTEGRAEILLNAENVAVRVAGRSLVEAFDLVLRRGERIAITGPNGSGKTLLLDTLAGSRAPACGRVTPGRGVRTCRAHQLPRWQTGWLRDHLRREAIDETHFRNLLGVLGIEGETVDRPLETFSEGERKKVEIVRSFVVPADLFVWDEPLNYLDIETREQIEGAILRDAPTLLFVEHDAWFTERVATREIRLGAPATASS